MVITREQGKYLVAIVLATGLGVAMVSLGLALPWLLHPLKSGKLGQFLSYPDGVTFYYSSDGQFEAVNWFADDWDRPDPCPLIFHLPRGDFGQTELTLERLRREGWTEKHTGLGIDITAPDRVLKCHFRKGALTHVTLDRLSAEEPGSGPLAVSYKGKRVELPMTLDGVKAVLGSPAT
jgi:hypothetical protein